MSRDYIPHPRVVGVTALYKTGMGFLHCAHLAHCPLLHSTLFCHTCVSFAANIEELLLSVHQFVEAAPLGEFSVRLNILHAFGEDMRLKGIYKHSLSST